MMAEILRLQGSDLLDEVDSVARRPAAARPEWPSAVLIGSDWDF